MTIDNSILLFILFAFFALLILLFYDRWVILDRAQKEKERLLDELSKAIKAVISKNANEYVMTTSIDKVDKEEKEDIQEEQEVSLDSLSDDEFDEALGIKREAPKK